MTRIADALRATPTREPMERDLAARFYGTLYRQMQAARAAIPEGRHA